MKQPVAALIVCTLNRTDDLHRTLASVAAQEEVEALTVIIVDASSAEIFARNAAMVHRVDTLSIEHVPFDDTPSLARQRNRGLDTLRDEIEVVHFLDDDVTLRPGYFKTLHRVLAMDAAIGGVGGLEVVPGRSVSGSGFGWLRRLFLLSTNNPGRVLISGSTTPAQAMPLDATTIVEWLGGCCAYRRSLLDLHRADADLEGYSLDEDLDLSYRIGRESTLVVEPSAVFDHHVSAMNRHTATTMARDQVIHRYWFVEKNIRSRWKKPAFWWSMAGRWIALRRTKHAMVSEIRAGFQQGLHMTWHRAHPLLNRNKRS